MPGHRRTARRPSRRHDSHHHREGSRHLAERVPVGPFGARRAARAALSGGAPAGRSGSSPISPSASSMPPRRPTCRRSGSGPTAPKHRSCSSTCGCTAATTTCCCSGRSGTTRATSACRSSADRAVLVPTAEEDSAIHIASLGRYFSLPAGMVYLTPEEQELVEARMQGRVPPSCIIGSGLDDAAAGRRRSSGIGRRRAALRALPRPHRSEQGLRYAAALLFALGRRDRDVRAAGDGGTGEHAAFPTIHSSDRSASSTRSFAKRCSRTRRCWWCRRRTRA